VTPAANELSFRLNGRPVTTAAPSGELLAAFIRDRLGLRGTKVSCDSEICGACTVLVDGLPVSSCCYLAADVDGRDVLTVEGARERPEFARIEEALVRHAAVQCGFCTPGFVMLFTYLLGKGAGNHGTDLAATLSSNLCRCTGYRSLMDAAGDVLADEGPGRDDAG
jgi:carbon-monoxide dehydrogenase small subunit